MYSSGHINVILVIFSLTDDFLCLLYVQVPLVASNRIGKEIIETEHGKSAITFYGNSFIAGKCWPID